ncbi:MAG: hypothetical protein ABIV48_05715 [Pyrinomonadaceae bacterium]
MNRFAIVTKPLILIFLIFANSIFSSAQTDSIYRLPAGTKIQVKLDAEINSTVSGVNDTFLAYVSRPVTIREVVVVPEGTVIEGRVAEAKAASSGGHDGSLGVVFESLKISNEIRRLDGVKVTPIAADSSRTFNILSILGGAVLGSALGAASDSSGGILIGAAIGAGAGT